MVPSPSMGSRRRDLARLLLPLLLALGLVVGASACAGSEKPAAAPAEETTTEIPATTVAPSPYETVVAKAVKPEVLVLADPPPGVVPDASSATSVAPPTTAKSAKALAAIPRVGLNSAGSRKTGDGWAFSNPTYFGNPLVFVVTERQGDWLRVMIPARPNGLEGWVKASDVELTDHQYRMELNLSEYTLRVFDADQVVEQTKVVIGKDATHTPLGRFYLNEKIEQSNPKGAYGPWILSTNGYSESLDTFDGGLPVIAFHGTNQPELIGSKASNGCIRMPNDVVTELAQMLPAGTPIDIVAG